MKTTTKLLAGAMIIMFCSIGNAQISYTNTLAGAVTLIYSNNFSGSGSVNITNTPANYEAGVLGGAINTNWVDALGVWDTNGYAANGTNGTHQGDAIVLPFTAQSNIVYTIEATVTFTGNPTTWMGAGFASYHTIQGTSSTSNERFTSGGIDWGLLTESTLNVQAYNSGSSVQFASENNAFVNGTGTPHTLTMVLDTSWYENPSNRWTCAVLVDGVPANGTIYNGVFTYSANPTILGVGLTQNSGIVPSYQLDSFLLFANRLLVLQQPASANINEGSSFTNTVVVGGTPPFSYQWYTNGGAIGGATNAALTLNSVASSMANTNYYCVVTNLYGSVTSSPASLGVYTYPQFLTADPITYTNLMTLFGGTNIEGTNYLGSSPTFSVNAGGLVPITYFWLTNGVTVGGAAATTFTFTNCQLSSPTNFTCIASNSLGTVTNTWTAQYMTTPTAPYPQLVIADGPVGYWRLDETNYDPNQYNVGEVCNDFMSGNNGFYTNTELAQPGYYVVAGGFDITNDPTETSAQFGPYDYSTGCDANSIGTNVDFSASANAEFSVSVWANGSYFNSGAEPVNGGIVIKGYYGTEEYGLDDGAAGGDVRFFIRTAANTVVSASSTTQLGGSNYWSHLVGVCDESNGVINLYINGLLVAQTAVAAGSGLLPEPTEPITIGASTVPVTFTGNYQFDGALDDVAIFNHALSAVQVNQLFGAAGGVTPLSLVAPLPPTNAVWMQNTTLTISATALGTPPLGYYWTNLTTDAIVGGAGVKGGSGTSAVASLSATLTITNAPPSLSGDELELVVTNATGSTNWFTTLFSYPPPVTIGYTNSVVYSNEFNGGTWSIAGKATTVANSLTGGTNSTWVDALGTNDTGIMEGSGLDDSVEPDSWILPFKPEPGFVYTLTGSLTFYGDPGNWVGLGFAQNVPTNSAIGYGRFSDGGSTPPEEGPNGYDWAILTESSGNVQAFGGAGGANQLLSQNGFFTAATPATHTVQITLDTTAAQWAMAVYVDGTEAGSGYTYTSGNPPIGAVGITQNTLTTPNNLQWNYVTLSAVSPNGFVPYLLAPYPSTNNITLTNSTLTLSASGIGTGPWGYYWSDNSTVIASGATNSTAPVIANLSVPESSLSAGQLTLTMTNALGTNITLITLISTLPTAGTNIMWGVTNGNLYMSWPPNYTGWQLQAQTNSLGVGLSTNWVNYNPSTGTNQVVIPMNLTNGTVFYRLTY